MLQVLCFLVLHMAVTILDAEAKIVITKPRPGCESLQHCQYSISYRGFLTWDVNPAALIFAHKADRMDKLCGKDIHRYVICLNRQWDHCLDETLKKTLKSTRDIILTTCMPERRGWIENLRYTSCGPKMDADVWTNYMRMETSCRDTFLKVRYSTEGLFSSMNMDWLPKDYALAQKQDIICPAVEEFKTCVMNGAHRACGQDLSKLTAVLWDLTHDHLRTEFACRCSPGGEKCDTAMSLLYMKSDDDGGDEDSSFVVDGAS